MDTSQKSPCFIIAEIAQAHDGSLGILYSLIDAVAETGVDAIKFQSHIAEAESSVYEPFRVKFSYQDKTRFDYWKRMEYTFEQWTKIKHHCEKKGVEFLSTPFSVTAVRLLESLGVLKYKVGSGDLSNFLMLEKIALTGKEIILSTGMSSFEELNEVISFLRPFGNKISVLQCTTKYPTPPEDLGLNVISELRRCYGLPVGLSDHSGTIFPSIAAVALGAAIVEVHITFDHRMFGPDAAASLTIDELKQMVEGVRFIEKSLKNPVDKSDISKFKDVKNIFEKSLAVNKNLPAGYCLTIDDLESKKPSGYGIAAIEYRNVLGRRLSTEKKQYDFLKESDLIPE